MKFIIKTFNVEDYIEENSIRGGFQLNFREKITWSQLRAVFSESKNPSNLMSRLQSWVNVRVAIWILSRCVCIWRPYSVSRLTSSFVLSGENHILDTLLPIFAANRARVNNFPGAYGTTSRKTMSADRSIEGGGKLNSNVYDFLPRVSNIWYKVRYINVLFSSIQEVSNTIKYIKHILGEIRFLKIHLS